MTGSKRQILGGISFEPPVLDDATENKLMADKETFDPVAALHRFSTEKEAIRIASNTKY